MRCCLNSKWAQFSDIVCMSIHQRDCEHNECWSVSDIDFKFETTASCGGHSIGTIIEFIRSTRNGALFESISGLLTKIVTAKNKNVSFTNLVSVYSNLQHWEFNLHLGLKNISFCLKQFMGKLIQPIIIKINNNNRTKMVKV